VPFLSSFGGNEATNFKFGKQIHFVAFRLKISPNEASPSASILVINNSSLSYTLTL